MGVASGFSRGSSVIGWAATDLPWMVTEVGVAFSCWLLSVTVGEEGHTHLVLANDRSSIRSCMKGQTMANSRVETNGCDLELHHQDQDSHLSHCLHACLL